MGYEYRLDAARADVAKLEKDLALERAACPCNCEDKRELERRLRGAKEQLRRLEIAEFSRMEAAR